MLPSSPGTSIVFGGRPSTTLSLDAPAFQRAVLERRGDRRRRFGGVLELGHGVPPSCRCRDDASWRAYSSTRPSTRLADRWGSRSTARPAPGLKSTARWLSGVAARTAEASPSTAICHDFRHRVARLPHSTPAALQGACGRSGARGRRRRLSLWTTNSSWRRAACRGFGAYVGAQPSQTPPKPSRREGTATGIRTRVSD